MSSATDLSLVRKLTTFTLFRMLSVLLVLDLLLCGFLVFWTLWQSEREMAKLLAAPTLSAEKTLSYEVFPLKGEPLGVSIPDFFQDVSPLSQYPAIRRLWYDRTQGTGLKILKYSVSFPEKKWVITYDYGQSLQGDMGPLAALAIVEILILLGETRRIRRGNRRILRPITEMSLQVQTLSTATPAANTPEELEKLKKWAGALSNIDASRLDQRLSVEDAQNELKDLAMAINKMLNRIDEAYQSQVRFVSDASHELRTPISVIQGYVHLLDRWGKNDPATLQESIDAIKSEAESMKNLIEQLLFLARGDSETLRLELAVFDCKDTVEEVLRETRMIDLSHTFSLKGSEAAWIQADRQLIKQALRILVENSIKYTPDQGDIQITLGHAQGNVFISVQDQGIGIDAENLPRIFDRFYRSEESRDRKTGGAGLGLAIMKWIVDRHGGTIEVVSRKDIGTRTTLQLPEAPKDVATPQ